MQEPVTPKSKAEKLISRGSENPKVSQAARYISDMLMRMALGQVKPFVECVEQVFPKLTKVESKYLSEFFLCVSNYFWNKSKDDPTPRYIPNSHSVRIWDNNATHLYDIHKVFCVLSCDLEYCAENVNCWETRSVFCRMDADQYKKGVDDDSKVPTNPET